MDGQRVQLASESGQRAEGARREGAESFSGGQRGPSALQVCLLPANLSCWHLPSLPRGRSTASATAPAHPPTRHGAGRNPERQPRVTEHPKDGDWTLNTDPRAPEPRWQDCPGKRASLKHQETETLQKLSPAWKQASLGLLSSSCPQKKT